MFFFFASTISNLLAAESFLKVFLLTLSVQNSHQGRRTFYVECDVTFFHFFFKIEIEG